MILILDGDTPLSVFAPMPTTSTAAVDREERDTAGGVRLVL